MVNDKEEASYIERRCWLKLTQASHSTVEDKIDEPNMWYSMLLCLLYDVTNQCDDDLMTLGTE